MLLIRFRQREHTLDVDTLPIDLLLEHLHLQLVFLLSDFDHLVRPERRDILELDTDAEFAHYLAERLFIFGAFKHTV